jgi:hypothetical protein
MLRMLLAQWTTWSHGSFAIFGSRGDGVREGWEEDSGSELMGITYSHSSLVTVVIDTVQYCTCHRNGETCHVPVGVFGKNLRHYLVHSTNAQTLRKAPRKSHSTGTVSVMPDASSQTANWKPDANSMSNFVSSLAIVMPFVLYRM